MDNFNKQLYNLFGISNCFYNTLAEEKGEQYKALPYIKHAFMPFSELDNDIENQHYQNYVSDLQFQTIYTFLSKFVFKNSQDFNACVSSLRKCIEKKDMTSLKKLKRNISATHLKTSKIKVDNIQLKKELIALQTIFNDKKILSHLDNVFNDTRFLHDISSPTVYIGQGEIAKILLLWIFLREKILDIDVLDILKSGATHDYIISWAKQNLNIKSDTIKEKQKFLNFLYERYITNGFVFHGTNTCYIKNIIRHGLCGHRFKYRSEDIFKTDRIMNSHGIYKVFEGKTRELKHIKYYLSANVTSAIYYSTQSPEYLSRFCGNGYAIVGLDYDENAFWRRDYSACLTNIKTLCEKNNILGKEKNVVLSTFRKTWRDNVRGNLTPMLVLVPRKYIGMDKESVEDIKSELNNLDYKEILNKLLHRKNFIIRFANIPKNFFETVKLPCTPKLIKLKTNEVKEKYIKFNDTTYTIDGFANVNIDFQSKLNLIFSFNNTKLIYFNNYKLEECSLKSINKTKIGDKPLSVIIAEHAIGLTDKFKSFQNSLRSELTQDKLINLNFKLAKKYIQQGLSCFTQNKDLAFSYYGRAVYCIASSVGIQQTGKYTSEQNRGLKSNLENYQVDKKYFGVNAARDNQLDGQLLLNNLNRLQQEYFNK